MRSLVEGHSGAESHSIVPVPVGDREDRIAPAEPSAGPINPAFTLFVAPGNRFVAGMQV